ncbi:hypothetical protein BC829DRAFT_420032 [Chytridium lagenaria]|nr:hypothetical protein BC829DRAFT_420032 [Chytridium lagenaria]
MSSTPTQDVPSPSGVNPPSLLVPLLHLQSKKEGGGSPEGGPAPLTEDEEEILEREWNEVAAEFNDGLPIEDHRSAELIKSHFDSLHSVPKQGIPIVPQTFDGASKSTDKFKKELVAETGHPTTMSPNKRKMKMFLRTPRRMTTVGGKDRKPKGKHGFGREEKRSAWDPKHSRVNIPLNNDHQTPVRGENRTMKRKLDHNKKILSSPTFSVATTVATRLGAQGIRPNNPISKEASDYKSEAQKRSRISSAVTSVVDSTSAITDFFCKTHQEEKEQQRIKEKALRFHELELNTWKW